MAAPAHVHDLHSEDTALRIPPSVHRHRRRRRAGRSGPCAGVVGDHHRPRDRRRGHARSTSSTPARPTLPARPTSPAPARTCRCARSSSRDATNCAPTSAEEKARPEGAVRRQPVHRLPGAVQPDLDRDVHDRRRSTASAPTSRSASTATRRRRSHSPTPSSTSATRRSRAPCRSVTGLTLDGGDEEAEDRGLRCRQGHEAEEVGQEEAHRQVAGPAGRRPLVRPA